MLKEPNLKKIIIPLYTLIIVCMGVATIVEKLYGKDYTSECIYGSWWFVSLWGLLATMSLAFLLKKRMHRKIAVFMLHVSFVVMLVGALTTHLTSEEGSIHLRIDNATSSFLDKTGCAHQLPFSMKLTDFDLRQYPATDAVMDYCCGVAVVQGGNTKQISVSMNNIGKVDGYRFYQSSYDDDCQGTHLLVAYDPYGIAITYTGYMMLLISLLWTMFSKHTRIRRLYHTATRPLMLLMLSAMVSANAQGQPTASFETGLTPVSAEIAHDFGKVVILYNGRLCPVNTAATEFVTKLSGKSSWHGYSADEIFVGWMIYYTEWESQKIIRVKNAEVQHLLGIDGKWASVRDFYTSDNKYKLSGLANTDSIPAATRRAIREVDEKMQVVTMFYNSEMLHVFPLATQPSRKSSPQPNLTWHTPGSTDLPLDTPEAEFQFINHAMDHLVQAILVNDATKAKQMIEKIRLYQKEKVGEALPSKVMVELETFYNTLHSARWVVFLFLTLSLLLVLRQLEVLPTVSVRLLKPLKLQLFLECITIGGALVFLTVMLVLRWIVSKHIPMSNGYETMLFMAWVTLLITLATMRRVPVLKAFGSFVASLCMLVAMIAMGSPQITQLMPVLHSPWLSIHVAMVMVAYAFLAMITLLAVHGLVLAKNNNTQQLTRTTALSQLMLYPAILTLSIGIFVGAVWANVSWGTYWSWDPKETWALITLMIYALPLHKSFMPSSPVRYHLYILLAFLTVLMTYFGVNYFLTGMHSYN